MKPLLASQLALAVAICSVASASADELFPSATPESQGLHAKDLNALADVVKGFVKDGKIVGGELLVVKNGRMVFHQGIGLKDKDKKIAMPTDAIFCIRSMTKPVVGVAIQMLFDEGKLALDDRIAKFLPSFDNDASRAITIRQLLTHTGGLKLSTLLTVGLKGVANVRELADIIGKNGPEGAPGKNLNYSDDGADTLTAVVGAISKMPPEKFIQDRILDPLGMKDTICVLKKDDPRIERVSAAYGGATGNWRKFWRPGETPIFPYFLGSQGMYSTPTDYTRFLKLIADGGKWNGKQLLSKAAIERILTPTEKPFPIPTGFIDWKLSYGQLMMIYRDKTGKLCAFGHGGSDGTFAYAIPDQNLFVMYFTQSRNNLTSIDFETALHGLLIDPTKKGRDSKPVDRKAVAPFLGLYWFDAVQCPVEIVVHEGKLEVVFPWEIELELRPTDEANKWSAKLAPQIVIEFQRDGDKPAPSLVIHQAGFKQELRRLKHEDGLPTWDELLKLRQKTQGVGKLTSLGAIRLKGSLEQLPAKKKGTVESVVEGATRCFMEATLGGNKTTWFVDGDKVWVKEGASAAQSITGAEAQQIRLKCPTFPVADWRLLFKEIEVLKRFEKGKKSTIVLRTICDNASTHFLYVDAETGRLVGDCHIEIARGIGRVGTRIQYLDYKDVDGVQFPTRIVQAYQSPLIGRLEQKLDKFETKVKFPERTFQLKKEK